MEPRALESILDTFVEWHRIPEIVLELRDIVLKPAQGNSMEKYLIFFSVV